MTTKKTGRKSQKATSKRLSRTLLEKSVADLTQRLERQYELAQAIAACTRPHEDQMMAEFNARTVFQAQMETLVRGLDDAHRFAWTISGQSEAAAPGRQPLARRSDLR